MLTIDDLLLARAAAMAEHDGVPVAVVHLFGAANQLQAELISARDRLLSAPAPTPEPEILAPEIVDEPIAAAPSAPTNPVDEPAAPEPAAEAPPAAEDPAPVEPEPVPAADPAPAAKASVPAEGADAAGVAA